jgi:hypothetical protein|tara:strand:- start:101 stop:361 length:261 start_codon:yes stop_codon:yes gene_type:complete
VTKQKVEGSIDGRAYAKEVEDDINSKAYGLFGSGVGKAFLHYLDNLTINNIHAPNTPPEQLSHYEGQRWVVALIKARCEMGRRLSD